MLRSTLVTLLIVSIGISRIRAEEKENHTAQLNRTQTPVYGGGGDEALMVQKNNFFNTGPNDTNIYGSIIKVKNSLYESPDSRQPTSIQTRTAVAPGGPGHGEVSQVRSEQRDHQGQTNNRLISRTLMYGNNFDFGRDSKNFIGSYVEDNNVVYKSKGGINNQTHNDIETGAVTVLVGNSIHTSPGEKNFLGSILRRNDVVFNLENSEAGKETGNDAANQSNSSDIKSKFEPSLQAGLKVPDNRVMIDSSYPIHGYKPSSLTEKNARDNKEEEAFANKLNGSNGQARLLSNVLDSFSYCSIILIYYLF